MQRRLQRRLQRRRQRCTTADSRHGSRLLRRPAAAVEQSAGARGGSLGTVTAHGVLWLEASGRRRQGASQAAYALSRYCTDKLDTKTACRACRGCGPWRRHPAGSPNRLAARHRWHSILLVTLANKSNELGTGFAVDD